MGWSNWISRATACRGLASLAIGLTLAVTGLNASAQISTSKHNLGTGGTGVNHLTAGTAEICVFCHTPHGSDTSAVVPLWNRKLGGQTYQTYDSLGTSTLNGKVAAVGSVSIACLSCHDGTQSMSAVINAPGSGGYNVASAEITGAVWTGANQTSGKLAAGIITNLGTDLRNDHPVGIQYGGGGITMSTSGGTGTSTQTYTLGDPDFKKPASAMMNGTRVWWVDTEATPNNTRQKTDMILYTRASTAGYTGQTEAEPFVECASCHDPHNAANGTFLRISNASSAVCLSCHIK